MDVSDGERIQQFTRDTASYTPSIKDNASLDEAGLIHAHAHVGFEPGRCATFPADADGIVPHHRRTLVCRRRLQPASANSCAVWGRHPGRKYGLAGRESGPKASETQTRPSAASIADKFFKDHLQTYKKRPSTGSAAANKAPSRPWSICTTATTRAHRPPARQYVVPLTGKIQSRIEMLQKDANAASENAARKTSWPRKWKSQKKHVEPLA